MPVDNLLGKRVYNHGIDETATIVDVSYVDGDPIYVILQYDDGMGWDEAIADEQMANMMGWDEEGLLSDNYELVGCGPTFKHSCQDHDWYPPPDAVWDTYDEMKPDLYLNITRCKRCGLSGSVVIDHGLGQVPPTLCALCDEAKPDSDVSFSIPTYEDIPLCSSCAESCEGDYVG